MLTLPYPGSVALIRKEPGQPRSSHSLTLLMVSPLTQVHSPTCYWKCSLSAQSCMESPSHLSPSPHPASKDVHRGRWAKDWPRQVAPARVSALSPPPQECPCVLTASCCRSWKLQVLSQGLTCLSWERRVSLLGLAMSWAQVRASVQTATTGDGVGGLGWGNLIDYGSVEDLG